MNIAIIFAGGSGVRMGAGVPKQFLEINGKPIIVHTLQLFQYHNQIDKIYISVLEEYISYMEDLVEEYRLSKVAKVISGGDTAQDSIYNALKCAQAENPDDSIVLLHDGVRPFVSYDVISRNIAGVKENGNAITCTSKRLSPRTTWCARPRTGMKIWWMPARLFAAKIFRPTWYRETGAISR